MTRWIPLLVALPYLACSGGSADSPSADETVDTARPSSADEIAGGSTEDFTGDMELCSTVSSFALDATTPLGRSGADVLANAEGRFEVPIRWMSLCQQSGIPCSRSTFCDGDSPERPMSTFAGTETTVSIEIAASGEPVLARHETASEQGCAESMSIPVTLRVQTADGALAEVAAVSLGSDSADTTQSVVALRRPVAELQGGLGLDTALPGDAELQMVFGFYGDKVWMEIDVMHGGSETALPVPLLSDLIPPFDACSLDLPRAEVAR